MLLLLPPPAAEPISVLHVVFPRMSFRRGAAEESTSVAKKIFEA
jgi:hypothetical protein